MFIGFPRPSHSQICNLIVMAVKIIIEIFIEIQKREIQSLFLTVRLSVVLAAKAIKMNGKVSV